MKKQDENRMSMLYSVKQVCDKHATVFGGLVPFTAAYGELGVNLGALEGAVKRQQLNLKGVALDKRKKLDRMVQATLAVANSVFAYAEDQGDAILQGEVTYSASTLSNARDAVVGQRCQGVHTSATAHVAELADYGVTATELTALQAAIDAYLSVIGSPRTALTVRKGATAEIGMLVKDCMKILNNRMDKLMMEFMDDPSGFHQEYFDARIIVDTGSRPSTNDAEASSAAA